MESFNENRAVGCLSELIALECGYDHSKARQIRNAAVLHDIGKQQIDKSILDKPGKLNSQEFEIIKTHTKLGVELMASFRGELSDVAKIIALFHHEWHNPALGGYWNVSSYYLPDYVSFVSISDVYMSLISKRPYKDAWRRQDALDYIENQSGTQFCPELVKLFTSLIGHDSRVPEFLSAE